MWLSLLAITLIGLILRLSNSSPFRFFPDAYQNLIVAENILNYQSVFGVLGPEGMFYPQFFMWTRPVYSLLINFVTIFGITPDRSAEIISLISGVLAIPLAYFFINKLLHSKSAGILASLIISISFNHTIWSGFIYTEPIANFLCLLFLITFTHTYKTHTKIANAKDLLTGVLFSIIVFTRYEYIILSILFIILIIYQNKNSKTKLINYFLGFLITSTIFLTQLFPITDLFTMIMEEFPKILTTTGILLIGIISFFVFSRLLKGKYKNNEITLFNALIIIVWTIITIVILQTTLGKVIPLYNPLTSLRVFLFWDPFFAILIITGITLMLKKRGKVLSLFTLLPILLLWPIYNTINPEMQRYWTHLIPFLLIPASYSANIIWHYIKSNLKSWSGKGILLTGLILLIMQIVLSNNGMKSWSNGSWYRESYEQKSAMKLKNLLEKLLKDQRPILISSLPESYYFYTRTSTQSIADQYPYIYIDENLNDKKIWVIEDMGMRDLFPNFTNSLKSNFSNTTVGSYWVEELYRFGPRSKQEDQPVIIYELTLKDLKNNI